MFRLINKIIGRLAVDLSIRGQISQLEDEVGSLRHEVEYLGHRLREFIDCGQHTTQFQGDHATRSPKR